MADSTRAKRRLIGALRPRAATRLRGRASLLTITLLLLAAGVAAIVFGDRQPLSAALVPVNFAKSLPSVAPGTGARGGAQEANAAPEALLAKTLAEIGNKRLDNALGEIDKIINAYPNFRLAHLVKGDLLLARARPISAMGNVSDAPQELIEDLRDEARARLARHHSERPKDQVPRYLVQMLPEQRYALVVDTAKSTLYVFENKDGEARYVTDFYATIGKQGMDKYREGDNKTPLGVYHVTDNITREMLNNQFGKHKAAEYGAGALPINYPNEWDRRGGRNGHGIWVHGVPFDTYSRPPRASNGCVALTNEDFLALLKNVQVGLTPVIIANGIDWTTPEAARNLRQELAATVDAWRSDWESLNTDKYLGHYSRKFASGSQNYASFSEYKRQVNAGKAWIKVKLENVTMFVYPGSGDLAVVSFDQHYSSSNLNGQVKRRQYWQKEGGAWKIVYEGPPA